MPVIGSSPAATQCTGHRGRDSHAGLLDGAASPIQRHPGNPGDRRFYRRAATAIDQRPHVAVLRQISAAEAKTQYAPRDRNLLGSKDQ